MAVRMKPDLESPIASLGDATSPSPVGARQIRSKDAIADLAFTLAVLISGGLVHWQFDSHSSLVQLLRSSAWLPTGSLLLLWSIAAAVHVARRRGLLILLTGAVILAPTILQLPYLYLCSEGHCP